VCDAFDLLKVGVYGTKLSETLFYELNYQERKPRQIASLRSSLFGHRLLRDQSLSSNHPTAEKSLPKECAKNIMYMK
jgi:hypothetical protein